MLFELRGKLPQRTKLLIEVIGTIIMLTTWAVMTELALIPKGILPSPLKVMHSFKDMHFHDGLVRNAGYSFYLNILGLTEAIAIALPLGFLIGLIPLLRGLTERYITAARFLPLTAVIGLFIAWFGIETNMKVQFLAFAIFIYLLPIVIQKVDEVEEVYVQTAKTLGAKNIQIVTKVFIPAVISRIFDDIRTLAALSWTYIVVAEMVNANGGGIGAMAYMFSRQARIDKVFGILIVIMLIGFIQDKLFILIDEIIFSYKYATKKRG